MSINVKVIAINAYGNSSQSSVGGGAVVVLVPDAPVNLVNIVQIQQGNQITLSWSNGVSTGGSVIIDYRILYDLGTGGNFYVLQSGIVSTSYTVTGLILGTTYQFIVQSRNEVGYSSYSSVITVLAATIPS